MIGSFILFQMKVSFSEFFQTYTFAVGFRTELKLDQKLLSLYHHNYLFFSTFCQIWRNVSPECFQNLNLLSTRFVTFVFFKSFSFSLKKYP